MSILGSIFFFHMDNVERSYCHVNSEQKMSKNSLNLGAKIPSIGSRTGNDENLNSILSAHLENSLRKPVM